MDHWKKGKIEDYIDGALSDVRNAKDYADDFADSNSQYLSGFLNNIITSLIMAKGFVQNIDTDEED